MDNSPLLVTSSLAPPPPAVAPSLVNVLNTINRNTTPAPRSVPRLVLVAKRVTPSIRAGSPFASAESPSRSSSLKPDLPSWTPLPLPHDSSPETEAGDEESILAPDPPLLLKIGPPRRTKPVRKSRDGSKPTDKHALEDLTLADDTTDDQGQQRSKARSTFVGVVISKPAPPKDKPVSPEEGQDLVSALAKAFTHDRNAITATTSYLRPAAMLRRMRNGILASSFVPLNRADIEAHLGTRVAPLQVPKPGGPSWADQGAWERWVYGPGAAHRLKVCLRHVEAKMKREEEGDAYAMPQVAAVPEKSRTRFFVERLNEAFGPGSVHRGAGPKPKIGSRQMELEEATGLRTRSGRGMVVSDSEEEWNGVMDNILLGKRSRSVVSDSEDGEAKCIRMDGPEEE